MLSPVALGLLRNEVNELGRRRPVRESAGEKSRNYYQWLNLDSLSPTGRALMLRDTGSGRAPSSGKPDDIPPVSEMIEEALAHAHELGRHGLRPAEMLSYIQGKYWPTAYWPTAGPTDVGPIAWRMWHRSRLARYKDGTYGLPEEEDAVTQEEEEEAGAK